MVQSKFVPRRPPAVPAAIEHLLAIGFQLAKTMQQNAAQHRLLETGKVITLAAADRMQCFLDGEIDADSGAIKDNFLQFVGAVGARYAVGVAELFQHAVGPVVQGVAALGLGTSVIFSAEFNWNDSAGAFAVGTSHRAAPASRADADTSSSGSWPWRATAAVPQRSDADPRDEDDRSCAAQPWLAPLVPFWDR